MSKGDPEVSVDADFVSPRWVPPSDGCMPTRAPHQCVPVHHDGYWGQEFSGEALVSFAPLQDGTYLLGALRAEDYDVGGRSR